MRARTYSTDVYLTSPAPTAKGARSASRCGNSAASHGCLRQSVSRSCTSSCGQGTTGNSKAKPSSPNRSANTQPAHRLPMIRADLARLRWAVSTGVGRRRPMTFRWSQRIGISEASNPGSARPPADRTASAADMSAAFSSSVRH